MTSATKTGFGLWVALPDGFVCPVPLTSVSIKASIIDLVAEVEIIQSYKNDGIEATEAIYKFPINKGVAVCEFRAEIDGRQFIGVTKESAPAQQRDNPARDFLFNANNEFKVKFKKMNSFSSVNIRLKFITELKVVGGGDIHFLLPKFIAPLYVLTNDASAENLTELPSKMRFTYTPAKLEFEATVLMTSGVIKDIRSPNHKITMSNILVSKKLVTLSDPMASIDQDLLLLVEVDNAQEGSFVLEKSANGYSALMVSFFPKLKELKTELIFVIDRSYSILGDGTKQVQKALELLLNSLPEDCYFNIIGFGSKFNLLFPKASRKNCEEALSLAKAFAEGMKTDLRGKEFSLDAILSLQIIDGYKRQVLVLTDGAVSDNNDDVDDEVVSLVHQHSDNVRVFALGLGENACRYLVEGIARAGNGTALLVSNEGELDDKVEQQLGDALHASWTDIRLSWDNEFDEGGFDKPMLLQTPANDSVTVFNSSRLVFYTLLKDGAFIPKNILLSFLSLDEPERLHPPSDPESSIYAELSPENIDGLLIHRFAVRKLIQNPPASRPSFFPVRPFTEEITKFACTYGLSSPYTSWVAVDSEKPANALVGLSVVIEECFRILHSDYGENGEKFIYGVFQLHSPQNPAEMVRTESEAFMDKHPVFFGFEEKTEDPKETVSSFEPDERAIAPNLECFDCSRKFVGRRRLARHYIGAHKGKNPRAKGDAE